MLYYSNEKINRSIFNPDICNILSQLFINLAAGWFGISLIVPKFIQIFTLEDFWWLIKNILFGILSLWIALSLYRRTKK